MTDSRPQRIMGKRVHSFLFFGHLRPLDHASRICRFQCTKYQRWHRRNHPEGIQGLGTVNQRGGF